MPFFMLIISSFSTSNKSIKKKRVKFHAKVCHILAAVEKPL